MKIINLNGKEVGNDLPCYVIAEIGVNHNGKYKIAEKLVKIAKKSGADAVKFQYHIPEKEMLKDIPTSPNFDKPLWEILEETNLT